MLAELFQDEAVICAMVERQREELVYCVDEYLAIAVPEMTAPVRDDVARDIVASMRRGETIIEACRRFGRESVAASIKEEFKKHKLEVDRDKNDVGNGERFAEQHASKFKFLDDRKVWVKYDGKRWRDATDGEIGRAAKATAKKMLTDAFQKPVDDSKEERAHALASLSRKGISNMIGLAQTEKVFSAEMKQFDVNPDALCVDNGVLNLRTGELRPHSRDDLITTLTRIKYDPEARCPRWEQFMREIFADDRDLIEFVQRAVGYSMTGHTREHAFFILFGGGRNGKGRFVTQLRALLGDASRTTRFQTFTAQRDLDSGNTPALASLAGARLVTAGEPDQGVKLSESTIKMLTGEDEIQVCRKHEHPFNYIPTYKIWLHCNHKPVIRGTDEGIWSRPRLIPFNMFFGTVEEARKKDIPEHMRRDPDKRLDAKLNAERAGILAWAVRGAMKWYIDGLGMSKTVETATDDYRIESDQLGPFIEECIRRETGRFATNEQIFAAYEAWCRRNLVDYQMEGNTLSKQLVARGFERGKDGKDRRGFKNIAVTQGPTLFSVVSKGAESKAPEKI